MREITARILHGRAALGVLSILAGFGIWMVAVSAFDIPNYLLPRPEAVGRALIAGISQDWNSRSSYWFHFLPTLYATILGFLVGAAGGIVIAAAMAESRLVESILFPYVISLQSIPKVAVAPLFIIWFGYQIESKVAIAATISLFPILMNSLQGFLSIERERLELMAALDASRWQIFWRVKLPNALPFIFAGLNIGIVYALLGTLVAEMLGGQSGVGVLIGQLQGVSDTAGVFSILGLLAVVGYVMVEAMRALQRRFVFWVGTRDLSEQS